jgi:hypothetical protein
MLALTSFARDHGVDAMGNLNTASGHSRHSAIKMSAILYGCIMFLGIRVTGQPATNMTNLLPMCEQRQELSEDMREEIQQLDEQISLVMLAISYDDKYIEMGAKEMNRCLELTIPQRPFMLIFKNIFGNAKPC